MSGNTQKKNLFWQRIDRGIHWILLLFSVCLYAFVTSCYTFRFDACAIITAFPAWIWFIPGFITAVLARLPGHVRWLYVAVSVMWVGFVLVFADEPASITRGLLHSITAKNVSTFRVVSVNCGLGNPLAALDAASYNPDILLLQESPGLHDVAEITQRLFGEEGTYLYGGDTVIIVRGKIESATPLRGATTGILLGHVKLVSGLELDVASIHFAPPPGRFDFLSPAAWKNYESQRSQKRYEVAKLAEKLSALPAGAPIVIGGDFNMPATDGAWDDMPPYLHDTFDVAGVGWGNTITSTLPVTRFDYIWAGENLQAVEVKAVLSKHTDHRMVVADIAIPTVASAE